MKIVIFFDGDSTIPNSVLMSYYAKLKGIITVVNVNKRKPPKYIETETPNAVICTEKIKLLYNLENVYTYEKSDRYELAHLLDSLIDKISDQITKYRIDEAYAVRTVTKSELRFMTDSGEYFADKSLAMQERNIRINKKIESLNKTILSYQKTLESYINLKQKYGA